MGSILYLHPEAQRIRLLKKMLLKTIIFVSLMAVAMGGPATRPPARPTYPPRNGESCGNFPNFMTGDRIVGGEAAASPIPWQVSVRNGQSGWGHFCGGTILDKKNCNVRCSLLYYRTKHERLLHYCRHYQQELQQWSTNYRYRQWSLELCYALLRKQQ